MTYTRAEIERIPHGASTWRANRRKKVTCVDKSNVLENSQLWRRVVVDVAQSFPTSNSIICWWTTARCSWC